MTEIKGPFDNYESSAVLSVGGLYRYSLSRIWNPNKAPVVFIMLNPSTADAFKNDPTINRCIKFSRRWGGGGLVVVNLFALRSRFPRDLKAAKDPVGPLNDEFLLKHTANGGLLLAAWGTDGKLKNRDAQVLSLLKGRVLSCLSKTKDGHPLHPLYVASKTMPEPFDNE